MDLAELIPIAIRTSVFLLVFALGLGANFEEALYLLRRPAQLVKSLLAMNIIMPVVAVVLVAAFDFQYAQFLVLWAAILFSICVIARAAEPLASWNDSAARQAILKFVSDVTRVGSSTFVAPAERIAVFDNDGTLWAEQSMYFQLAFALDRVRALAPQRPEWKTQEPYASLLKGDLKGVLGGGEKALLEIVMATHAGMTTEEFEKNRARLACNRETSQIRSTLQRDGLPAYGRAAALFARERI
jgi:hypothetical protein